MDFPNIKPKTKDDLLSYIQALTETSSQEEAEQKLPSSLLKELTAVMVEKQQSFDQAASNIKTYLNTMKGIKIYLSEEPSQRLVKKIITLFSDIHPHRYLEFIIDSSVIAGVKVSIDGNYYDESIDTLIDKKLVH